jgi:hypothetical protein
MTESCLIQSCFFLSNASTKKYLQNLWPLQTSLNTYPVGVLTLNKYVHCLGSVENYHAGVEIDARRKAKNVDVDVDIAILTYFL